MTLHEDKYEDIILRRSFFAAGRWLTYPALLALSVIIFIVFSAITRALRPVFLIMVSLPLVLVSVLIVWVSAKDWRDEYYIINSEHEIVLHYQTPMQYRTERRGSLATMGDAWSVRNGFKQMLFNFGDVHIQVGWSKFPFKLRDVNRPDEVVEILKKRAYIARQEKRGKKPEEDAVQHVMEQWEE